MLSKQIIGKMGEDFAADLLKNKSYEILERNWRYKRAEIDLIAKIEDILVFVEVRTRQHVGLSPPEKSISEKKKLFLISAANAYMDKIGHEWEVRFDVVSIIFDNKLKPNFKHFEDAFFR